MKKLQIQCAECGQVIVELSAVPAIIDALVHLLQWFAFNTHAPIHAAQGRKQITLRVVVVDALAIVPIKPAIVKNVN